LLIEERFPHVNFDELCQTKIPALKGRAEVSNLLILETIAIDGPSLKYDVWKKLKRKGIEEYSTITRRIDSLRKKGYLAEAGRRFAKRGKQEAQSMYGLTWKGFIASFASPKVRQSVLQVVERNPPLVLPQKEFVLLVLGEVFEAKEIEEIVYLLISGCLRVIPNFEAIDEEELAIWILHGLREIPPDIVKINTTTEKAKDLTKLLDNPKILQYLKEKIIPMIAEWERNFSVLFQFFKLINEVGEFIKELCPMDRPSEKLRGYLKTMKLEERMLELEKQRSFEQGPDKSMKLT